MIIPKKVKESTIVIGLLAKDCAKAIEKNIPEVEKLGACFADYHIIIYENNSTDGTKELLTQWQSINEKVLAITEDLPETDAQQRKLHLGKNPTRIQRIADCRNRVLEETRKRFAPDFFCFIDIDIEWFSSKSIVEAIEHAPDDWGALFANGRVWLEYPDHVDKNPFPYDSYAFVKEGVNPANTKGWVVDRDFHPMTAWVMNQGTKRHAYFGCHSAFGGIGIYRWELLKPLYYSIYQTPELKAIGACMCEHIPVHIDIVRQGYRLYIVRDMEVCYWRENPKVRRGWDSWKNHHHLIHYFVHQRRVLMRIIWQNIKDWFKKPDQLTSLSPANNNV